MSKEMKKELKLLLLVATILLGGVSFVLVLNEVLMVECRGYTYAEAEEEFAAIREVFVLPNGQLRLDMVELDEFRTWWRETKALIVKADNIYQSHRIGYFPDKAVSKLDNLVSVFRWIESPHITHHESGIRAVCAFKSAAVNSFIIDIKEGFGIE